MARDFCTTQDQVREHENERLRQLWQIRFPSTTTPIRCWGIDQYFILSWFVCIKNVQPPNVSILNIFFTIAQVVCTLHPVPRQRRFPDLAALVLLFQESPFIYLSKPPNHANDPPCLFSRNFLSNFQFVLLINATPPPLALPTTITTNP